MSVEAPTTFPTAFQIDRSKTLYKVSKNLLSYKAQLHALSPSPITARYSTVNEYTKFDEQKEYQVTPRVAFGIYLVQKALVNDIAQDIMHPSEELPEVKIDESQVLYELPPEASIMPPFDIDDQPIMTLNHDMTDL